MDNIDNFVKGIFSPERPQRESSRDDGEARLIAAYEKYKRGDDSPHRSLMSVIKELVVEIKELKERLPR